MDAATGVWDNATMSVKLLGWQQARNMLKKELDKFTSRDYITVGIHEDAGNVKDGTETQAQNGAKQNYGDPHNMLNGHPAPIPARPWLIPGVESAKGDILDIAQQQIAAGASLDQTLDGIGLIATGAVQQYMTDLKTPPNAKYTIEQKGSSNPLIDTGSMRASVTHKIVNTKPEEGI